MIPTCFLPAVASSSVFSVGMKALLSRKHESAPLYLSQSPAGTNLSSSILNWQSKLSAAIEINAALQSYLCICWSSGSEDCVCVGWFLVSRSYTDWAVTHSKRQEAEMLQTGSDWSNGGQKSLQPEAYFHSLRDSSDGGLFVSEKGKSLSSMFTLWLFQFTLAEQKVFFFFASTKESRNRQCCSFSQSATLWSGPIIPVWQSFHSILYIYSHQIMSPNDFCELSCGATSRLRFLLGVWATISVQSHTFMLLSGWTVG